MTNMVVSKTMHHSRTHAVLGHTAMFPCHAAASTPQSYPCCFGSYNVSLPCSSIHTTQPLSHLTTLTAPHACTSWNSQEQGLSRFIVHQFSQLLPQVTNCYIHIHTETVLPRRISSVASVTSVTSTGDCHTQVLPSSLTGENIDLFTKTLPLT